MQLRIRPSLAAVSLCVSLLPTGCSLIATAEPPAADLSGSYGGVIRMEGDEIPSGLRLDQSEGRLEGTLDTDVGLTASGDGRLEGTVLRLELDYDAECRGQLHLTGQALDGGARLAGTLEAHDCTGAAEGSFSLSRR